MSERVFLIRLGAYGDILGITPLVKYLKEEKKWEVYFHTSERGMELIENNPYIDKIIPYKSDSVTN